MADDTAPAALAKAPGPERWADASALAAAYFALALMAIHLARQPGTIATLWFANAAGIAWLAMRPRQHWPGLLIGVVVGNIAAKLLIGDRLLLAASFVPGFVVEIVVGAWLLRRAGALAQFADDAPRFVRTLIAGAVLPQLAGATLGALALHSLDHQRFGAAWGGWYVGSVLGAVAVLPFAIAVLLSGWRETFARLRLPATVLLMLATVAVCMVALPRLPYPFVLVSLPLITGAIVLPLVAAFALPVLALVMCAVAIAFSWLQPSGAVSANPLLVYAAAVAAMLPAQLLAVVVQRQRSLTTTLAALSSASIDLTSFVDLHGIYRATNRAHESYFDLPRDRIIDRHIGDVLPRDRYETLVRPKLLRAMDGETLQFQTEIDYPGRGLRTMVVSYQPATDEHGQRVGVIMNGRDITTLAAAQRTLEKSLTELRAANESLEQFVRISSHDLREPLNTIIQFVGLVEQDHGTALPPAARTYFGHITDGAQRMRTLLDDMLRFVRQGAAQPPALQPVALDAVLADVVAALKASIDARAARVSIDALPTVNGQATLLALLFQNLVSNAIKFVPPERVPDVSVRARTEGDSVFVEVLDNGVGIAPEQQPLLFTPFKRLYSRRLFEGTGLGLATARRVTVALGGTIELASVPGEGSCFTVRLQRAG